MAFPFSTSAKYDPQLGRHARSVRRSWISRDGATGALQGIAVGAAIATAILVGRPDAAAADQNQAAGNVKAYNIPVGLLDAALASFAKQSGLTLSVAPGATDGKTTAGLAGNYSPADGLRLLVSGNGLNVLQLTADSFRIDFGRGGAAGSAADRTGEASSELPTLVVTASAGGMQQDANEAPASISAIPRQELESKPYRDIADALSSVPGVVTTGGSDRKEINIRGMSSDYTLTLIDGKRTDSREASRLSDGWGQMNAWSPPVSAIERIEIVRGPMSALYGADAIGGVVNIITRKVAKEWSGELSTDTLLQTHRNSGNGHQGNFYLTGPIKQDLLSLQVYGQYSKRAEDKIYYGYRDSNRGSINAKLAFTPTPDHDFVVEANHTEQNIRQNPGKSIDPSCITYSYFGCADPYRKKVDVDRYSLSHTGRWSFGTSETYVQQEKFDVSSQDIHLKNTEFRTSWAVPVGDHVVTVGGGAKRNELHDSFSNTVTNVYDITRTQWSLFAEDAWYLTDDFSLTSGLRMDDDNRFGRHWSPRIYGVWGFAPEWTLKGGVTFGFKSPEMTQVAGNYASAGGLGNIYGNANLKPEKSINQEIGVLYSKSGVSGGITLFNNNFRDKITSVACSLNDPCYRLPGGAGYFGRQLFPQTYDNVDRAITRGVEGTLRLPLADDVTLDTTYTYTYSRQETGAYRGKPLNKLPQHLLSSTMNYKPTDDFATWARLTYRGKDSENVGGVSAALQPINAPSYTVIDIGSSYEVNKNVKVRAAIYNVGDKKIRYDDYGFVEDGRRFWLGMTAKF